MSYDLMVFDPETAPLDTAGFMEWYESQTEWSEGHSYQDPEASSPALRSWFLEMIERFPAMNGPYASPDLDSPRVTDYSVGREVIYAAFAWSQANQARTTMINLAKKHRVGFFDVSSQEGLMWRPPVDSQYEVFYCFNQTGEEVPGHLAMTMDMNEVLNDLLPRLESERDFLGLIDSRGTTLQVMYHPVEDRFWAEIPVPDKEGSYGMMVDLSTLKELFGSLPKTFSANDFSGFEFQPWRTGEEKKWWKFWD